MKTNRILAVVLLLALLPVLPVQAEERTFVPTAQWEPPEIVPEEVLESQPWLLALKIAQEEVGYIEGPGKNESKYGTWFAKKNVPWCAEFLSWCAHEADLRYGTRLYKKIYPKYGKPDEGAPWFLARERFVTASDRVPVTYEKQWLIGSNHYLKDNEYLPYPGDYLWISYYTPQKTTDHVAIVEGVSVNEKGKYVIHVIEGNSPDRVQRAAYPASYGKIFGYGTPVRRANRVVRLYDTGKDILPIQAFLVKKGFLNRMSSKEFSAKAVDALKAYQAANRLKKTGAVDLATRNKMEKDPLFQAMMEKYADR